MRFSCGGTSAWDCRTRTAASICDTRTAIILLLTATPRRSSYFLFQVRRQFDLGLLDEGSSMKPDYKRCVELVTTASLRQMVAPVRLHAWLDISIHKHPKSNINHSERG